MYRYEKNGDLVIDGFANGIAASPHKGIANMQSVNISTEMDEVMCSYSRTQQSQITITGGTFTATSGNANLAVSAVLPVSATLLAGTWVTIVVVSGMSGFSSGTYYVKQKSAGAVQLSSTYSGAAITPGSSGTATFVTVNNMAQPVASCTETYSDGTNTQYRYYIVDSNALVWVQDTGVTTPGIVWFLPDRTSLSGATATSGIAVLNGWLFLLTGNTIWVKPTSLLGSLAETNVGYAASGLGNMLSRTIHATLIGHQSTLYYTDSSFVGSIFPNITASNSLAPNIFSYASWTSPTAADNTVGTIGTLIGGVLPTAGLGSTIKIPVQFYSSGALSSDLQSGGSQYQSKVFYLLLGASGTTFTVFAAATGGSAVDITSGASGTQYFNTFNPSTSAGAANIVFSPEALTLPSFDMGQCLAEIGNQVLVGCKSNTIYQWDQVSAQAQGFVVLPENNTTSLLTVNNMAYAFTGNKGNIYVTNGSTSALAVTVPDYCAGIQNVPSSYVEPYFTWGGVAYIRGRIYFSILDQTSSKAGNCGGIWSFIPTQNFSIQQDQGLALRLENQNTYGTYNGVATVIIGSQNQLAASPQYWSAWYSSISNPTYGIDFTDTTFSQNGTIETEIIPVGTMLDKKTDFQIEYKVAAPLVFPEAVTISYRQDATSAFTSCGSAVLENVTTNGTLSGYFSANFEKSQWLQLKITLVASGAAASSSTGTRLATVRIR